MISFVGNIYNEYPKTTHRLQELKTLNSKPNLKYGDVYECQCGNTFIFGTSLVKGNGRWRKISKFRARRIKRKFPQ